LGPGLRRGDATRDDEAATTADSEAVVLRGFPPIIDRRTETLILGSFPSEASLAAGQYYAHPRNQFWRLLGELLGEPLAELGYAERASRVLAHRVGIWDVLDACRRPGSLDAAIRDARPNDFAALRALAPRLKRVLFNGGTAGRFARQFVAAGFAASVLPSSSPAHAGRSYEQKLALWRAALRSAL
jgi:hypoxanthine-DNA glycosylase